MPAKRLPDGRAVPKTPARAYAVVGMYSDAAAGNFVRHVAILREDTDLKYGEKARVWHMGPPLVAGEATARTPRANPQCVVHVVGSTSLSLEEIEAIRDWLSEVDKEESPANPFRR